MGSLHAHDRDENSRLDICQHFLLCYENEDEAFLQIIMTADEM
jgi:hypothetical protein